MQNTVLSQAKFSQKQTVYLQFSLSKSINLSDGAHFSISACQSGQRLRNKFVPSCFSLILIEQETATLVCESVEKSSSAYLHGLVVSEHGVSELKEGSYVCVVDLTPNLFTNTDLALKDFTVSVSHSEMLPMTELTKETGF